MKKTIFIVGAGRGLGTAIGRKFGENDFRVVLMARNEESLKAFAEDFTARGIEVYTKVADAADDASFVKACRKPLRNTVHLIPEFPSLEAKHCAYADCQGW